MVRSPSIWGLCFALGFGVETNAAEQPAAASVATEAARAPEGAIERAKALATSARDWCGENLSKEALSAMIDRAEAAGRRAWMGATEATQGHLASTLGLRRYVSPPDSGEAGGWARLDPQSHPLSNRIVLLVHGLDEPGNVWDDLAPELARAGHTVVRFDYPNDQALADSADALASALRDLRAVHGVASVSIVGHSMGGLIARDVLTRPDYYDGHTRGHTRLPELDHVICVASPHHGCGLTPMRFVIELRDQICRWVESGCSTSAILGGYADGDGEAGRDLSPGSAYLVELDARRALRETDAARVTNIVAEYRPVTAGQCKAVIESSLAQSLLSPEVRQAVREWCESKLHDLGDGIVSGGSLEWSQAGDVAYIPGDHRSVLHRCAITQAAHELVASPAPEPSGIAVILDRLSDTPTGIGSRQ
ncbi:MAG TPA: alpha/beta fold hydrolase [Phycisphaerales bacterium]|nr:alpha/beta fold hydrolase [Phycisphaerales bacterium]